MSPAIFRGSQPLLAARSARAAEEETIGTPSPLDLNSLDVQVDSLVTKDGHVVRPGRFAVLVGANNAGKSQTLREIHSLVLGQGAGPYLRVLSTLNLAKPHRFDDLLVGLSISPDRMNAGQHFVRGIDSSLTQGQQVQVNLDTLRQQFEQGADLAQILNYLGRFQVALLDAGRRLEVAKTVGSFNVHDQAPGSLLQGLFVNRDAEEELRKAFRTTFGMDVRFDYSAMQNLSLRIAPSFPEIPPDPRDAYLVMRDFPTLDEQGDGFRSFTGVVLSLLLASGRVVLLDEPEAFLHPAQARRLGRWIATHVGGSKVGQVIVATHNASFLSGVLSAGTPVDIFRVNREGDRTTFNPIPAQTIDQLVRSPVLSSQRVIEAIFHRGVVVCEADADRALYQAVCVHDYDNHEILFLHAHNKQAVPPVVAALRSAGVPTASITDIDILDAAREFEELIRAHGVLPDEDAQLIATRERVAVSVDEGRDEKALLERLTRLVEAFLTQLRNGEHDLSGARGGLNRVRTEASRWTIVKERGVEGLNVQSRQDAEAIIRSLMAAGVFVVPVGELESWIDLGTRQKSKWIVAALDRVATGSAPLPLREFVRRVLEFFGEIEGLPIGPVD